MACNFVQVMAWFVQVSISPISGTESTFTLGYHDPRLPTSVHSFILPAGFEKPKKNRACNVGILDGSPVCITYKKYVIWLSSRTTSPLESVGRKSATLKSGKILMGGSAVDPLTRHCALSVKYKVQPGHGEVSAVVQMNIVIPQRWPKPKRYQNCQLWCSAGHAVAVVLGNYVYCIADPVSSQAQIQNDDV
jgi:hypothetical protein